MNTNEYTQLFKQIARTELGREQNLEEIERRLEPLRKGAPLSYADLEVIANPQYWPFTKYWMWPERIQIEKKLERTEGFFTNLPTGEIKIIGRLNVIFKNIALVSIGLRFARPDCYAIYSWPVLQILRIERGRNAIEEYVNYITEMRILKDCFGVKNVSEVDKIVWAIFHLKGKHEIKLKKILADKLPENLSPEELIIYLSQSPIKVAKAYMKQRAFMTAGFWVAKDFEKFLDEECRRYGLFVPEGPNKRFRMIEVLCNKISLWRNNLNRRLLIDTRWLRNKIIPGVQAISCEDVEQFIFYIDKLRHIALYGH